MTEPTEQPAKPLRTWRPMAVWTAAIFLALGLAWFVGTVVVPVWQVRRVMRDFPEGEGSAPQPWQSYIDRLGGPERAAAKLGTYLRAPRVLTANRYGAAKLLSTCGKPAVPFLIRALGDSSDERICRVAAYGLGKIGPEARAAVAALEASLTSQDAYLRMNAALALHKIDPTSRLALQVLDTALSDERAHVRMYALGEVAACGPEIGLRPLLAALNDSSDGVRSYAANALRQFSPLPDNAIDDLARCLADTDTETRLSAVSLLGDIGPHARRTTPDIERALKDKSPAVRTAAAEALKKIRGESGCPPTPSSADVVHRPVCSKCGYASTADAGCPRAIWEHCPHKDSSDAKRILDGLASSYKRDKAEYRAVESAWGAPQWRGPGDGPWSGCTQVQYRVYDGVYNFMIDKTGHVANYELAEGVGEYECPKCGGAWNRE